MSENFFVENTEDKTLEHKIIEESEASQRNESKNIITTSEADSENGKKVVMTESKLHKEPKVIKSSIQSEDLLILRLGSDTNSTSNLLEKGEHSSSSQNVIAELLSEQEVKEFPCLFCNKKFSTSQALGGHQNAHKRERILKKMEQKKREEEMNSTLRYRPSFPYSYPYAGPIHYQAYPYLCGNLQVPVGTQMNNVMSSWLGSPSGSYGEMYMPNTLSSPPSFMMQVPKPPHAPSHLRMTNLVGGNQNPTLSVSQRPNNMELRLSSLTNQTPPSNEDAERNSNAQFPFQGLTIETRDLIQGSQLLTEVNVSSSSTTESTSEGFDLNLKL